MKENKKDWSEWYARKGGRIDPPRKHNTKI